MLNNKNGTLNALICDDDIETREILVDTFQKFFPDFRSIVTARDGLDALQKIDNQKFDLIIFDQNMPRRKGVECIRSLLQNRKINPLKVILLTGELDDIVKVQMKKLKCPNVFEKPFNAKEFVNLVQKIIKLNKLERSKKPA